MKFRIVTACALMLTACAGSNATRNSRDAAPSQNSDFIMAEELAVVQGSQAQLLVYVDGIRYAAGIESLRLLPLRAVASLQYFSPGSAEGRFGPGHLLGAIEVITAPH